MASIITSQAVGEITGKLGGATYKNQSNGVYVATPTLPTYQTTSAQLTNRQILAALSSQWRSLTPELQEAWNAARLFFPLQNKFGETYYSGPLQLFLRVNFIRVRTNLAATTTPPTPYAYPLASITFVNASASSFNIGLAVGGSVTDLFWMVYTSRVYSAGRSSLSLRSHKLTAFFDAALSQTVNINNNYIATWPGVNRAANQKIFVSAYLCSKVSSVRNVAQSSFLITT